MSKRDEIANAIQRDLCGPADEVKADAIRTMILHHLTKYAIGRWVPVGERLPDFDQGCFCGHTIMLGLPGKSGSIESDIFPDVMFTDGEITHWLDVDMPSGKEEV